MNLNNYKNVSDRIKKTKKQPMQFNQDDQQSQIKLYLKKSQQSHHSAESLEEEDKNSNQNSLNTQKAINSQKINQYFQFFLKRYNPFSNWTIEAQTNHESTIDSLLEEEKIVTDFEASFFYNRKQPQQTNLPRIIALKDYQTYYRQKIQQNLLRSKRFTKVQSFTTNLIFHQFFPSKHYEIVKLQIQLLWYKTQICILNELQKSPLNDLSPISGSGSFGYIYFANIFDEQIAIKCIPLSTERQNEQNLYGSKVFNKVFLNTIKEYIFALIFSELEIGPKIKTISGFDLIVFEDCVQFGMEICFQLNNKTQSINGLFQTLFKMHMLQIVHRDIKPTNIMYSQIFQKYVFIDFGCSQVLTQNIGEKSLAKFMGTTAFCSQELLQLLSQTSGYADLYFSDFWGLRKSIEIEIQNKDNSESVDNEFILAQSYEFEIYRIKFFLYNESYEQFKTIWKFMTMSWCEKIDQIQIKLLNFYPQLKPNEFIKQFYYNEISQSSRQKPQFKNLQRLFKNHSNEAIAYFCLQFIKKNNFEAYELFYKSLPTHHGNLNQKEKQIQLILSNKHLLEKEIYLKMGKLSREYSIDDKMCQQFMYFCLMVAKYVQVGLNPYQFSIQEKVNLCKLTLKLAQKIYQNQFKSSFTLIFDCPIQKLQPIIVFYHFFLFNIWNKLPPKHKEQTIEEIISTFCFLGFPSSSIEGITFLSQKFIKSDQLIISKDLVSDNKLQRILYYWQARVMFLIFENIFYNRIKITCKLSDGYNIVKEGHNKTDSLMKPTLNETNRFWQVNFKFYKSLLIEYLNFDEKIFTQLNQILKEEFWKQPEFLTYKIKKWKFLIQIALCYLSFTFKLKDAYKIFGFIEQVMAFAFKYKKSLLPYLISFFYDEVLQSFKQTQLVYDIIDRNVSCMQISFRFEIHYRFTYALEKDDTNQIDKIARIITKQLQTSVFEVNNMTLLQKILDSIYCFLSNRLKQTNVISKTSTFIIIRCFDIVRLTLEVGLNYQSWQKSVSYDKVLKILNADLIQDLMLQRISIKSFFSYLLKTGQIYVRLSSLIKSHKEKNQNFPSWMHKDDKFNLQNIVLEQKYVDFIEVLPSIQSIFNFVQIWISFMKMNPKVKLIIKQNRTLSMQLITLITHQIKYINPKAYQIDDVVGELIGEVKAKNFYDSDESPFNLPNFEIAFDYFQIKLNESGFAHQWCEQFIELYDITIKKGNFNRIIHQEGFFRILFKCFIYLKKSFEKIQELFFNFTISLKRYPVTPVIKSVENYLNKLFWCKCDDCVFENNKHWNIDMFIEHLSNHIDYEKVLLNPYMSMVYFQCMTNKPFRAQIYNKFSVYILKSINHVVPYVRQLIRKRIHYFVYAGNFSFNVQLFMNSILLKKDFENESSTFTIKKQKINSTQVRKFIYYYTRFKKNQEYDYMKIEERVKCILCREWLVQGYHYPQKIRSLLIKKFQMYFKVKFNIS